MTEEFEEKILEELKPTEEIIGSVEDAVEDMYEELDEINEKNDYNYEPELVGSVAKGTFLRNPDIDMFIKFPRDVPRSDMERIALHVGRELLNKPEERYAEHPYIHGRYKGFKSDIVPCYELAEGEGLITSVDRTPLHTEYIIENLSEDEKDEVVLLKGFLKGIGAYSAETKVRGFSGYLCELLVHHYGSFKDVLEESQSWKIGERIELIDSDRQFDEPLVVIDPTDSERNVASALSEENMTYFIYAAKRYLDEPDRKFFFPDDIEEKKADELVYDYKDRGTHLVGVRLPRPDVVEDNLYPQVQKAKRNLVKQLEDKGFVVFHSKYYIAEDELILIFELEQEKLPKIEKHMGPPIWSGHTESFREKYGSEVYIEDGRLKVDRKRKYVHVRDVIEYTARNINLGSRITPMIPEKMEIYDGEKVIEKYPEFVNKFFDRRFPWER
ncbi:MAG: CCA tRNA nucleotidyltransferase [Thermoplasmatota archaeon]